MHGVEPHVRVRMEDLRAGDPATHQLPEPVSGQPAPLTPSPAASAATYRPSDTFTAVLPVPNRSYEALNRGFRSVHSGRANSPLFPERRRRVKHQGHILRRPRV